jgi:hypothetical protein
MGWEDIYEYKVVTAVTDYSSMFFTTNDLLLDNEATFLRERLPINTILCQVYPTATTTTAWFIAGNLVGVVVVAGLGELEYVPWPLTFSIYFE